METNDSRQSGFNAAKFRSGIKFAMQMGLPGTVSERVTFFWDTDKDYASADTRADPYDWTVAPASSVSAADIPASLTLPVSVEFIDARTTSGDTTVGAFDSPRIKLTVLDDEFAILTDSNLGLPNGVTVDGSTYLIEYWAPPVGLFDVSVYTAYAAARDEA